MSESGVFAIFREIDRQFDRRLFDALLAAMSARFGVYVFRGAETVQACSGTASEVTLHAPDHDWPTLQAALVPILQQSSHARVATPALREALFRLLPQTVRQQLAAADSMFCMPLGDDQGPRGFAVLVRDDDGPPFSEGDALKSRALAALVSLSLAEHSFQTERSFPLDDGNLQLAARMDKLSRQERRIATLIADGYAVVNIAVITSLTEHTVRTYIRRIYKKLGVCSRADLVRCLLAVDRVAS